MKRILMMMPGILIAITCPFPVSADLFYWSGEYKALYDDKIAVELKYNKLRKEYISEKARLEASVRDQASAIDTLNDNLAACESKSTAEQKRASDRLAEINTQLAILRKKGSAREKELIDENRKLNDRFTGELKSLRDKMSEALEADQRKYDRMRAESERKNADQLVRIREQDALIDGLKKLSDTQKAELGRLTQQADELESKLNEEIQMGQLRLKKMRDRIIINLDDKICFDTGSALLKPDIKKALDKITVILAGYPEKQDIYRGEHRQCTDTQRRLQEQLAIVDGKGAFGSRISPRKLEAQR